jgi:hypothetical protein
MNAFPDFSILPEPELLASLEAWIARAIIESPEELRRVLYKVDISEAKAREAAATENGPRALALLLLEREREKALSRANYKAAPLNPDADLAW